MRLDLSPGTSGRRGQRHHGHRHLHRAGQLVQRHQRLRHLAPDRRRQHGQHRHGDQPRQPEHHRRHRRVAPDRPATDSASGQTLTYTATGLPAGLSSPPAGLIRGTPTTVGTSNVTVTAKDGTGATGSTSFTWTISSTGGCSSPGQKLGNPGFETGTASPWTASSGVLDNTTGEAAHSGSWKAWLNGYGTAHTDTLSQSVTIPAGCSATFSFYLHIDTAETGSTAFDTLTVQAGSTTLATYSNANAASGYTLRSFNLSSFAGQTVTLKFTGTEDSSLQTSFVIDDTALNAS